MQLFKDYMLQIIAFCAAECKRQGSGEESVAWMVNAYNYAAQRFAVDQTITEADILELLRLIEPEQNANGYRLVPVTVGGSAAIPWENIPRQIANLLDAQDRLVTETPEMDDQAEAVRARQETNARAFYTELEKIHPGKDGNGRLGAVLYNVMNGTLYNPVTAPDVFAKA